MLAVGSEDGVVAVWDVPGARRLGSAQQHSGAVWALAASRGDGSLLASGELWPAALVLTWVEPRTSLWEWSDAALPD
jgi:WD40 repeat protein